MVVHAHRFVAEPSNNDAPDAGSMEPPDRLSPSERRRAAEDVDRRRRVRNVSIGAVGLGILFAGAIASLFVPPGSYVPFILLEIVGVSLIVVSFVRLRRVGSPLPRPPSK